MRDRLVRWFGDPSPWSDPTIAKALATQTLSLSLTDRLRFFDKWQRQILVTGGTERTLGAESGMSQTYHFGPYQFAEWMEREDVDHLLRNRWERWQFFDITDMPWLTERPRMTSEQWLQLLADFALLGPGRRAGTKLSAVQAAKDAAQRQKFGNPTFVERLIQAA
jgi:hypothetical protein